jgi:tetratricopeptide (TPR) repeat protein
MDSNIKKEIEDIFRDSNSSDELFDAFQYALEKNIIDLELYKILLANPYLSQDMLIMFTEKLCSEFHHIAFDICLWTGNIFENRGPEFTNIKIALEYYSKAAVLKPSSHDPYISMLNLYQNELDYPTNDLIFEKIENGIEDVKLKSKVYEAMSSFYKKLGKDKLMKEYMGKAEKARKRENQ